MTPERGFTLHEFDVGLLPHRRSLRAGMVPLILLVAALLFVLISVLLVVVGALAVIGQVAGGVGGGVATIVVAVLPLYLAYLFGRSAWRIRLSLTSVQGRGRQRSTLTAVVGYAAILIASNVFVPVPGSVKVLTSIVAVAIVPVLLAAELEPRK
jgi:hypothetical protein